MIKAKKQEELKEKVFWEVYMTIKGCFRDFNLIKDTFGEVIVNKDGNVQINLKEQFRDLYFKENEVLCDIRLRRLEKIAKKVKYTLKPELLSNGIIEFIDYV